MGDQINDCKCPWFIVDQELDDIALLKLQFFRYFLFIIKLQVIFMNLIFIEVLSEILECILTDSHFYLSAFLFLLLVSFCFSLYFFGRWFWLRLNSFLNCLFWFFFFQRFLLLICLLLLNFAILIARSTDHRCINLVFLSHIFFFNDQFLSGSFYFLIFNVLYLYSYLFFYGYFAVVLSKFFSLSIGYLEGSFLFGSLLTVGYVSFGFPIVI